MARELEAFSPLTILGRGYTLVKDDKNILIKSAKQLSPGQKLQLFFADDKALVSVEQLSSHNDSSE